MNQERCECHECTQARWKMSMQGQLVGTATYSLQGAMTREELAKFQKEQFQKAQLQFGGKETA